MRTVSRMAAFARLSTILLHTTAWFSRFRAVSNSAVTYTNACADTGPEVSSTTVAVAWG